RVRIERRERPTAAAAALIERNDAIAARIEEAPGISVAAAARPSVQEQGGSAARIAGLLIVDPMPVADVEIPRVVRLEGTIELLRGRLRPLVQIECPPPENGVVRARERRALGSMPPVRRASPGPRGTF